MEQIVQAVLDALTGAGLLEVERINCAIAMPAGTESSVRTRQYVAEGAEFPLCVTR